MNIGLLGLSYNVGNKGCEALAYSFLEILNKIAQKNNEKYNIYLITNLPLKKLIKNFFNINKTMKSSSPSKKYDCLNIKYIFYRKNKNNKYHFFNSIKKCDMVFDFTAGDSFSDIYGKDRFYERTILKEYVINKNVPLILGSQTIGPFEDDKVREFAIKVINNSYEVFARDEISYEYTKKICNRIPVLTTDIAFELPYEKSLSKNKDKFKIGINISGLLWSGGYTKNNQFNLKVDYKKYCIELIKKLLEDDKNEIHIISHATSIIDGFPDNDLIAANEIKKMFPKVILVDKFNTAMDAKSYIASMDFFIGARMHATIAALSSKVPIIAFSYSRKFEGLFNSLDYKYVLDTKNCSTTEAVKQTLKWIDDIDQIKKDINSVSKTIDKKNKFIEEKLEEVIYKAKTGGN